MPSASLRSTGASAWRWLLLALLLPALGAAGDRGATPYSDRPLDFSLHFSQADLDLDYGGTHVDTSVDRVGIVWRERYGERLQLALLGGYSFLTQGNNAPTAGRELEGYHAGVSLDLDLAVLSRATVFLHAVWLYQNVDDETGGQRVNISWSEPSLRFGASGALPGGVRVYGGVRYGRIDGRQRLSGTLNETRNIEETDRDGGFLGLELALDGDGYVGAIAESGMDRRAGLYFGRRF